MHIIDRRLNPGGKSLANRQRFIRRARSIIKKSVHEASGNRSIKEADSGGDLVLPGQGMREPSFRRSSTGGVRDYLLPGNKEYTVGDEIPRPENGGGGSGSDGSQSGEGEDEFRFALSRDEFVDLFLEDLELPNLVKRGVANTEVVTYERAGYSVSGNPTNLALLRTVRNSLSRRIALHRPKPEELQALRDEIETLEPGERRQALEEELTRKERRSLLIPFIDPLDVRYKRFDAVPKPVAQAVMFCLMDVSGSMNEHMKDLAKRFYILLFIFLRRRYKNVEIVFIRHTHTASEVDEDTFFHSPESGGTVVSTALLEMQRIIEDRFDPSAWNIYGAQASDGDNTGTDNERTANLLVNNILPACQYFAYLEVGRDEEAIHTGFTRRDSDLWKTYEALIASGAPMTMRKVGHRRDIYPVFRSLFGRKQGVEAA